MLTFLKAQTASIIASLVDYLITNAVVLVAGASPSMVALASVEGAACGGVVNFIINRTWVFNEAQSRTRVQITRYVLVWTGSVLLNASGMYLITYFTTINVAISKILVSVSVGVFYNYFLQKRFVFK
ncbi:MAG: GtrA family protein [Bacteroidota bacterium]